MSIEWFKDIVVVDRSAEDVDDVWYAFSLDELLCEQAHSDQKVICHLWKHKAAVILGQRDSRLPYVRDALQSLEQRGYQTCIRHSGGAAVPLDDGVLNISLIFPAGYISESAYHDGFEKMMELICATCNNMPYQIEKGEIVGAYCPGDFDLSIEGLKFCGIAQRRKIKAYIVQAFINIDGDSFKRAEEIKLFYEQASRGEQHIEYPAIVPQTLASLAQFGSFLSSSLIAEQPSIHSEVQGFISKLIEAVQGEGLHNNPLVLPQVEDINKQAELLKQRYAIV